MSVFTQYSAASERNTSLHRHTPAAELIDYHAAGPLAGICVPVSGDMLAVLAHGTPTQRRRRRQRARAAL